LSLAAVSRVASFCGVLRGWLAVGVAATMVIDTAGDVFIFGGLFLQRKVRDDVLAERAAELVKHQEH
jgi:hypothetical protein